jgi:hypothetical protein
MREIRTLRATWNGPKREHGRDASTWTGALGSGLNYVHQMRIAASRMVERKFLASLS